MQALISLTQAASPENLIDVLHRYVEAQSNHPTESGKAAIQDILSSFANNKNNFLQLFSCADSMDERGREGALTPYGKLGVIFRLAGELLDKKEDLTAIFNAGSRVVEARQELANVSRPEPMP